MIWYTMPDNLQRALKKVGKHTTRASETAALIRLIKKFLHLIMIWYTMPDNLQRALKKVGKHTTRVSETDVLIRPIKKFLHSGTIWKLTPDNPQHVPKSVGKDMNLVRVVIIQPIKKSLRAITLTKTGYVLCAVILRPDLPLN